MPILDKAQDIAIPREKSLPNDKAYAMAYFIVGCLASQHILDLKPADRDSMDLMINAVHIVAKCVQGNLIDEEDGWLSLPFHVQK
jgi:hypothetical protein